MLENVDININDFSKSWKKEFEKCNKLVLNKHKIVQKQVSVEMMIILNVIFQKIEISIRDLSKELMMIHKFNDDYYGITNSSEIVENLYQLKKVGFISSDEMKFKITKKGCDFRNNIHPIWFQSNICYYLQLGVHSNEYMKYFEKIKQEFRIPM